MDEVHSSLLVHIDMIRYLKMLQDPVSFSSLVTRFLCAGEVIKVVEFPKIARIEWNFGVLYLMPRPP